MARLRIVNHSWARYTRSLVQRDMSLNGLR